jgi:hypothetical protein
MGASPLAIVEFIVRRIYCRAIETDRLGKENSKYEFGAAGYVANSSCGEGVRARCIMRGVRFTTIARKARQR